MKEFMMLRKIKSKLFSTNGSLKKSMILNMLCKPIGMIISFIYTPILLSYLGEESYGLWSTILSVINWINYFDIGIGNGLRNLLSKYIAENKKNDASKAVSTGYIALSVIAGIVFLIGTILIFVLDLGVIFNTDIYIKPTIWVSFFCICINFVLALSKVQLYAIHQAEKVGFMIISNQAINLIGIIILSIFTSQSLLGVAIVIGFSGILVNLLYSRMVWKKYVYLIPKIKKFNPKMLRSVCNVGIKFFLIQMAALVLYSTDNIIITRLFGPKYVTSYHMVYSVFGIVNGVFGAFIAPLWSKYTVALSQNDYLWIKKSILKLDLILPVVAVLFFVGMIVFEPISYLWLHRELSYENGLIASMALYYFFVIWGSIYTTVMNGIGRINLQLILSIIMAFINVPLSVFLGKNCDLGTTGVCLATVICVFLTELPVTIDIHVFLEKKIRNAYGQSDSSIK